MRCCRLLMHGGTQTVRFWGLQYVHWGCEGSCCCFLRLQSRLVWDVPKALQGRQGMCGSLAGWFQVAIQAVDWFVPEHHLCIGLRCRFCEVLLAFDHGGTQTVRFWGLQYVHWGCEGSCCFLRLQSRLVWDVPKALQGRQGMCGSLAGWFQVAIQAVDWFVPEHHLCIGLRCRFCEVLSAFDAWWHANSPLLGATICPLGVWRLMLLLLAAAKQVGLRCSQGFARSTGDVRQPGRLVSGGYPGRRLVCSRASSMYWFKVSFLWGVVGFWSWWHANSPLLGATICPLGVWRLMLLLLAAAKQVGLRCSQGFARSTGDVRQPGRLVSGGYPGRRLVCSRASSMYWFKVSFLRGKVQKGWENCWCYQQKRKGKHLRKLEYI